MYITINEQQYPSVVRWTNGMETIFTGDSIRNIESITGIIGVYANDGFHLRDDDPSQYLRTIIRDGAITLTNIPEDYVPPRTIEQRVDELEQTNSISFVALAENGEISDETAINHTELFQEWESGVYYRAGNIRRYLGHLYRVREGMSHVSQDDWTPDVAVSLWELIQDPALEWPPWEQPTGAHNAYALGAKVSHVGRHWISDMGGNAYEPGVAGWTEAS